MSDKIRVLVIDDSAYNRRVLTTMLSDSGEIEVVGRAADGEEGLKLALSLRPDAITLDLEMPRLDGFGFLRLLQANQPTPVIVISSHSDRDSVFTALELGALDFIAKPGAQISPQLFDIRETLIAKILAVRLLNPSRPRQLRLPPPPANKAEMTPARGISRVTIPPLAPPSLPFDPMKVVAIASSTGGPQAVRLILAQLPGDLDAAVVIAQHMPERFTAAFADRLNRFSALTITEGSDGAPLRRGVCYIAPGGFNTLVVRGDAGLRLAVVPRLGEDKAIPSGDRLLRSLGEVSGPRALAVVLTGMGSDGSFGVVKLKQAGGRVIAESEATAVVFGMPKEAIATGCVDVIAPLENIAEEIVRFIGVRGKPAIG